MSDKEIRKTPLLRFQAYEKAWKECKLGEISDRITRKNTNLESTLPLTISAQHGLIDQQDFFDKQVASRDISGYFLMENGEFAYNKSYSKDYPWGAVKRLERYAKGVLSTLYIVFKPKNVNPSYLVAYYDSFKWHKEVSMRAAEGARNHGLLNISPQDFFETQVAVPMSENEQERIGRFFEQIDEIISLYQRELELLQLEKKMLASKMFPKDGEIVPEIRFRGFTDKWEKRKLGEIGSVSMCRRIFKDQTTENGDIPFYKIGTFGGEADAYISKELFEEYKAKYPYPQKGDILISASGSIGRTVEFTGRNEYFQDSNIVWLKHDERLTNTFLKSFYSVVKWSGIEGSTIKRLYNDNILNTVISLPSVSEQKAIGAYFQNLDHLITLHQRKFEAIKKMKKTLLKYMFI